jgi:hypothetical protein
MLLKCSQPEWGPVELELPLRMAVMAWKSCHGGQNRGDYQRVSGHWAGRWARRPRLWWRLANWRKICETRKGRRLRPWWRLAIICIGINTTIAVFLIDPKEATKSWPYADGTARGLHLLRLKCSQPTWDPVELELPVRMAVVAWKSCHGGRNWGGLPHDGTYFRS